MKFILISVFAIIVLVGCSTPKTTLELQGDQLRRACKSGIVEYDDGNTSFKCQPK